MIELAFEEARTAKSDHVGPEHMLFALLIEGDGIAAHLLRDHNAPLDAVRDEIERLEKSGYIETSESRVSLSLVAGVRVLVHDDESPHTLREGRVVSAESGTYEIVVPGRPGGETVSPDRKLIHPIPVSSTMSCEYCRHAADVEGTP